MRMESNSFVAAFSRMQAQELPILRMTYQMYLNEIEESNEEK